MTLEPSTVVVRSDAVLSNVIDGDVVMLSIESGKYFGLDAVGTAIWDLLAEPRSLEELCRELTDRYDVDAATCRREVGAFVQVLLADATVRIV